MERPIIKKVLAVLRQREAEAEAKKQFESYIICLRCGCLRMYRVQPDAMVPDLALLASYERHRVGLVTEQACRSCVWQEVMMEEAPAFLGQEEENSYFNQLTPAEVTALQALIEEGGLK